MIFPYNFNELSFSLHCYYVYKFKNYYWILHIQYQFTITVCEILLNTTQNRCMESFSLITVYYIQDLHIQNI